MHRSREAARFQLDNHSSRPGDAGRYHFGELPVPWEISIINGTIENPKPLGSREDVIAAFAESLPGVLLQRQPAPPPEILDQVPPFAREALLRPSLEADFEIDDLSIHFQTNDEPTLQWINGEVRGN